MPGCASRSLAVVADLNVRNDEIFGTFGNGASTTVRPLASFFSVIFGRFNGRAGPGGGGVFCWATTLVVNSTIAISIFISVLSIRVIRGFTSQGRGRSPCDSSQPNTSPPLL